MVDFKSPQYPKAEHIMLFLSTLMHSHIPVQHLPTTIERQNSMLGRATTTETNGDQNPIQLQTFHALREVA